MSARLLARAAFEIIVILVLACGVGSCLWSALQ